MNKIKRIAALLFVFGVVSAPAQAEKHLIFLDGYLGWFYSLPAYVEEHHAELEQLPFSGFTVVGNVFTSYVMSADPNSNNVTYERVWNEVSGLQNIFQVKKDNFLRINLDFPGDFWDDDVWSKTSRNFASVAKAAKNLGFKGIMFDDEAYANGQHTLSNYMSNFKFPKRADVQATPANYEQWEVDESNSNRGDWVDYKCRINGVSEEGSENCAYRNLNHSFVEHMDKVASRFADIMVAMQAEFPEIHVLVLHGPATGQANSNINNHYIKPNSIFETNEYKGAMFVGFKQGLAGAAELHDLGEFYSYSTDQHFQAAYQWRKHDIASAQYNDNLDASYRWVVPESERASWSNDVGVGFMLSDYDQSDFGSRGGYNTGGECTSADVESRFINAFDNTDDYVVFYSDSSLASCGLDNRWMDVSTPVTPAWLNMLQRVFNLIKPPIEPPVSSDPEFMVVPLKNNKAVILAM